MTLTKVHGLIDVLKSERGVLSSFPLLPFFFPSLLSLPPSSPHFLHIHSAFLSLPPSTAMYKQKGQVRR